MTIKWFALAMFVVIIAAAIYVAATSVYDAHHDLCAPNNYNQNEYCTKKQIVSLATSNIVRTLDEHGATIAAVFTIFLAIFTLGLVNSTEKLWAESKAATAISDRTARAAEASARAAEQSFRAMTANAVLELRAYVFLQGFDHFWSVDQANTRDVTWRFVTNWENGGKTRTKQMRVHVRYDFRNTELPEDFDFDYATTAIGRAFITPGKSVVAGGMHFLSADDLVAIRDGTMFFYIYGWAKYFDAFGGTPERITRFCYRVEVVGDPTRPLIPNPLPGRPDLNGVTITYRLQNRNNCADDECQPQA